MRDSFFRCVAEPIDPLQPRTVAEVEARDRIDGRSARRLAAQEVPRRRAHQRLLKLGEKFRIGPPMRPLHQLEHDAVRFADGGGTFGFQFARQPPAKSRHRRQRDECRELRHLAADFLDHLFDQEIAERHAGKPALAIRDGIEHRGTRLVRLDEVLPAAGEDRRDGAGYLALEGDLDEDQRLVHQRRMEEGVAAPVGRMNAAAQIVPTADLVHGFVADELFEHDRGRRPVDTAKHQEAAVEPRREQMDEVGVDLPEVVLAMLEHIDQLLAHAHQSGGAAGREIEPPEQLLAARLGGGVHFRRGFVVGLAAPDGDGRLHTRGIRPETFGQRLEKGDARAGGEFRVAHEDFTGECDARGLATAGEKMLGQFHETFGASGIRCRVGRARGR